MTQYTNNEGIPLALTVLFVNDLYDHSDEPNTISVTTLLDSVRQIILGLRATGEGTKDVSNMIASAYGTAIHSALEEAWKDPKQALLSLGYPESVVKSVMVNPSELDILDRKAYGHKVLPVYQEQRITKQIAGWNVSGKFDIIIDGRLNDLKNRKVWAYLNSSNDKKDILQASIYRWLNQEKVTEEDFSILWLFTDWNNLETLKNPLYPKQRWLEQKFKLLSIRETEQYLNNKLALISKYLFSTEEDLPLCTDEELWMSKSVWKYYKNRDKMNKSTKNFDNYQDAYMQMCRDGSTGVVREVKSKATRCSYCSATSVCSQYKSLVNQGLI
jgi:hypothetical protein